jgi:hypothetical protein
VVIVPSSRRECRRNAVKVAHGRANDRWGRGRKCCDGYIVLRPCRAHRSKPVLAIATFTQSHAKRSSPVRAVASKTTGTFSVVAVKQIGPFHIWRF